MIDRIELEVRLQKRDERLKKNMKKQKPKFPHIDEFGSVLSDIQKSYNEGY